MLFPQEPKIKRNARDITKEYLERNNINDDCIDNVTVNQIVTRNIQSFEPNNRDDWDRINDWQDYPVDRKLDFK
jgi:hypothetical protein